jgi:hypothetical protein
LVRYPAILRHALPHTMAHHAVAHPAGIFFVALVLLHFLPMSRDCGVIGILLSPRRYPAADQSECDSRHHENVFCHGNLPLGDYVPFLELSRREIDPNEYQQWRRGIITAPVTKSVCFGLTGSLTDRTRNFIL